jgi:putative transposase
MQFGSMQRLRNIHPADFCLALVTCACGDKERSIASARRTYDQYTGYMPEESSFYAHFNDGSVKLLHELFRLALTNATVAQRKELEDILGEEFLDLIAGDCTQICLPKSASALYPSTTDEHGGLKLSTLMSVMCQQIHSVTLGPARDHDRKALHLPRWLHRTLLLLDRGYFDHRLFSTIDKRGGSLITPLKINARPTITAIREGMSQRHIGARLGDTEIKLGETVDIDAQFGTGKHKACFRITSTLVAFDVPGGNGEVEIKRLWYVTNLPAETFSPEMIAILYRFRWNIEKLFHALKSIGRLDQLRSAKREVIETFVYATLLGIVLSQDICAQMRRARPEVEPSLLRVTALLLGYLPKIVDALPSRKRLQQVLLTFEDALWKEGKNPNPGRKYKASECEDELRWAA